MVIVAFPPGEKYAVNYTTLDQYDYGQILRIQGLKLPKTVEVHFSAQETGGTSITRIGVTKDGVTDVLIPDSVLENGDTTQNYSIFAFVYVTDATSGKTEYRARLEVKARPKPEVPGGGDNPDIFHEAVLEVRKSAEKAEEAQRQAEGWAHGREDLPERAEDNAKYYSRKASEDAKKTAEDRKEVERLVESVSGIDEQVAKIEKLSKDAQEAATQAGTSAEQAELHKQAAETASSAAQTAAQETEADKVSVEKLSAQVQKNKESVDKTAQDFALNTQQALADVNNAGQTQTERVQSAGTTAVENIENAQNTATRAVETAKSEAIKAVQTEGTTQTGNVTAEGEKQVQAVQAAAQEIIADREQIAKNATDIADLRQKKADAIVETASGTLLNVKDSANAYFENFSMAGKTTQDGTPTPDTPVEIVNVGEDGNIEIKVTGKNLIDEKEIYKSDVNYFISDKRYGGKGIDLKAGTAYTFSVNKNVDGLYISTYSDTPEDLTKVYGQQKLTYTPENDVKVQLLLFVMNKVIKGTTVQLEEGELATDHETYREPQTITLSLDRPLTKWDKLVEQDGQIGWLYKGKQYIVTGEEPLRIPTDVPSYIYGNTTSSFLNISSNDFSDNKGYLNKLSYIYQVWSSQSNEEGYCLNGTNQLHVRLANNRLSIEDTASISERKKVIKAHIKQQYDAGTPYVLWYESLQEEFVPLPQEQQEAIRALQTYYPTTVVSNSENMEMELSYVADTKNYTDRKIEETVSAQTQNLANLLSLMPLSTQAAMIEADTNNILDNMEVQK